MLNGNDLKLILLVFTWVLVAGCSNGSPKHGVTSLLLTAEKQLENAYFRTDELLVARQALIDYIKRLDVLLADFNTDADRRAILTGKALAITRLEFLNASEFTEKQPNLYNAINCLRNAGAEYANLTDKQIAEALIQLIQVDAKLLPWLRDFDGIARRVTWRSAG